MTTETILLIIGLIIFSIMLITFFMPCPDDFNITFSIDISGKRNVVYKDYIDETIIAIHKNESSLMDYYDKAKAEWIREWDKYVYGTLLWRGRRVHKRTKHYKYVLLNESGYECFVFIFFRKQTRYKQSNYQKTAYTVDNPDSTITMSLIDVLEREKQLKSIDYQTPLTKYFSKNQRNLLTPTLRDKIKKRDNYTCQICGKYMPDDVGLQIDHIKPVAKGGKTVESNLQVLCSKCNGSKSTKYNT